MIIDVEVLTPTVDVEVVGSQGPKGDKGDKGDPGVGLPEVYVQPDDPPVTHAALWLDTDEIAPVAPTWWAGTQASYDALVVKDPNTMYIITGP